ncbi:MAG: hypothetical protein ABH951_01830 [Patescibacteria group bacterium]
MQVDQEQLKKFILDSGLLSRSELDEAVKKAINKKQKLGNILLSDGKISEADLKKNRSFCFGYSFCFFSKRKN